MQLATILHAIGKQQQATISYKNVLRLQPNNPQALGYLAKLGVSEVAWNYKLQPPPPPATTKYGK